MESAYHVIDLVNSHQSRCQLELDKSQLHVSHTSISLLLVGCLLTILFRKEMTMN